MLRAWKEHRWNSTSSDPGKNTRYFLSPMRIDKVSDLNDINDNYNEKLKYSYFIMPHYKMGILWAGEILLILYNNYIIPQIQIVQSKVLIYVT